MPTFRVNVSVEQRGPLFNAAASQAAAERSVVEVNETIAQEGVTRIRARLDRVLRNPTGFYLSRIVVERRQVYRGISDSNVVYGGWLEGIDPRNSTTRFKGYRTFKLVRQELERDKVRIAEPVIARLVKQLGG